MRKVYGETASDNSDYGELRAIVRRIEMNQKESSTPAPPSGASDNQTPPDKKLVFDYVPASVMMKK